MKFSIGGRSKMPGIMVGMKKEDSCVADEAHSKRCELTVKFTISTMTSGMRSSRLTYESSFQIVKCFERQHIVALPGTQLSTFAWHQTCVRGKFFSLDWEKPRGQAEVSPGVSM